MLLRLVGTWACCRQLAQRCALLGEAFPKVGVCRIAASRGGARLLQWGWDQNLRDGSADLAAAAVDEGDLETLRLAVQLAPASRTEDVCARAARAGRGDLLAAALAGGCPWDLLASRSAACGGHLDILRQAWADERWIDWANVVALAAGCGHLEVLQWAHGERPYYLQPFLCEVAAAGGQLAVLRWLRGQGGPWRDDTACAAASGGLSSGMWQLWTRRYGIQPPSGSLSEEPWLELLQWAVTEGCPLDVWECRQAATGRPKTLAWLSSVDDR